MSGFNDKEVIAIQEFRKRLADVLPQDDKDNFGCRNDSLIRWIIAREMDLDKAEEMFRNSLKWRENNKINSILTASIDSTFPTKFPYYLDGVDKHGRPILTIPYGTWDVRSCLESEDAVVEYTRYCNQLLERIMGEIKRRTYENAKRRIADGISDNEESECVQFVTVANMEGYSYRQLANIKGVQALIHTLSVYEAHYPETLAHFIVINAPAIFPVLFALVKPFLSGRTLDKVKIFSGNKTQWQPVVLELMEAHEIRPQFGGTKTK